MFQTQITREGLDAGPSMWNRKPYRSKALKAQARANAVKGADGAWRSTTPTMMHPEPKGSR